MTTLEDWLYERIKEGAENDDFFDLGMKIVSGYNRQVNSVDYFGIPFSTDTPTRSDNDDGTNDGETNDSTHTPVICTESVTDFATTETLRNIKRELQNSYGQDTVVSSFEPTNNTESIQENSVERKSPELIATKIPGLRFDSKQSIDKQIDVGEQLSVSYTCQSSTDKDILENSKMGEHSVESVESESVESPSKADSEIDFIELLQNCSPLSDVLTSQSDDSDDSINFPPFEMISKGTSRKNDNQSIQIIGSDAEDDCLKSDTTGQTKQHGEPTGVEAGFVDPLDGNIGLDSIHINQSSQSEINNTEIDKLQTDGGENMVIISFEEGPGASSILSNNELSTIPCDFVGSSIDMTAVSKSEENPLIEIVNDRSDTSIVTKENCQDEKNQTTEDRTDQTEQKFTGDYSHNKEKTSLEINSSGSQKAYKKEATSTSDRKQKLEKYLKRVPKSAILHNQEGSIKLDKHCKKTNRNAEKTHPKHSKSDSSLSEKRKASDETDLSMSKKIKTSQTKIFSEKSGYSKLAKTPVNICDSINEPGDGTGNGESNGNKQCENTTSKTASVSPKTQSAIKTKHIISHCKGKKSTLNKSQNLVSKCEKTPLKRKVAVDCEQIIKLGTSCKSSSDRVNYPDTSTPLKKPKLSLTKDSSKVTPGLQKNKSGKSNPVAPTSKVLSKSWKPIQKEDSTKNRSSLKSRQTYKATKIKNTSDTQSAPNHSVITKDTPIKGNGVPSLHARVEKDRTRQELDLKRGFPQGALGDCIPFEPKQNIGIDTKQTTSKERLVTDFHPNKYKPSFRPWFKCTLCFDLFFTSQERFDYHNKFSHNIVKNTRAAEESQSNGLKDSKESEEPMCSTPDLWSESGTPEQVRYMLSAIIGDNISNSLNHSKTNITNANNTINQTKTSEKGNLESLSPKNDVSKEHSTQSNDQDKRNINDDQSIERSKEVKEIVTTAEKTDKCSNKVLSKDSKSDKYESGSVLTHKKTLDKVSMKASSGTASARGEKVRQKERKKSDPTYKSSHQNPITTKSDDVTTREANDHLERIDQPSTKDRLSEQTSCNTPNKISPSSENKSDVIVVKQQKVDIIVSSKRDHTKDYSNQNKDQGDRTGNDDQRIKKEMTQSVPILEKVDKCTNKVNDIKPVLPKKNKRENFETLNVPGELQTCNKANDKVIMKAMENSDLTSKKEMKVHAEIKQKERKEAISSISRRNSSTKTDCVVNSAANTHLGRNDQPMANDTLCEQTKSNKINSFSPPSGIAPDENVVNQHKIDISTTQLKCENLEYKQDKDKFKNEITQSAVEETSSKIKTDCDNKELEVNKNKAERLYKQADWPKSDSESSGVSNIPCSESLDNEPKANKQISALTDKNKIHTNENEGKADTLCKLKSLVSRINELKNKMTSSMDKIGNEKTVKDMGDLDERGRDHIDVNKSNCKISERNLMDIPERNINANDNTNNYQCDAKTSTSSKRDIDCVKENSQSDKSHAPQSDKDATNNGAKRRKVEHNSLNADSDGNTNKLKNKLVERLRQGVDESDSDKESIRVRFDSFSSIESLDAELEELEEIEDFSTIDDTSKQNEYYFGREYKGQTESSNEWRRSVSIDNSFQRKENMDKHGARKQTRTSDLRHQSKHSDSHKECNYNDSGSDRNVDCIYAENGHYVDRKSQRGRIQNRDKRCAKRESRDHSGDKDRELDNKNKDRIAEDRPEKERMRNYSSSSRSSDNVREERIRHLSNGSGTSGNARHEERKLNDSNSSRESGSSSGRKRRNSSSSRGSYHKRDSFGRSGELDGDRNLYRRSRSPDRYASNRYSSNSWSERDRRHRSRSRSIDNDQRYDRFYDERWSCDRSKQHSRDVSSYSKTDRYSGNSREYHPRSPENNFNSWNTGRYYEKSTERRRHRSSEQKIYSLKTSNRSFSFSKYDKNKRYRSPKIATPNRRKERVLVPIKTNDHKTTTETSKYDAKPVVGHMHGHLTEVAESANGASKSSEVEKTRNDKEQRLDRETKSNENLVEKVDLEKRNYTDKQQVKKELKSNETLKQTAKTEGATNTDKQQLKKEVKSIENLEQTAKTEGAITTDKQQLKSEVKSIENLKQTAKTEGTTDIDKQQVNEKVNSYEGVKEKIEIENTDKTECMQNVQKDEKSNENVKETVKSKETNYTDKQELKKEEKSNENVKEMKKLNSNENLKETFQSKEKSNTEKHQVENVLKRSGILEQSIETEEIDNTDKFRVKKIVKVNEDVDDKVRIEKTDKSEKQKLFEEEKSNEIVQENIKSNGANNSINQQLENEGKSNKHVTNCAKSETSIETKTVKQPLVKEMKSNDIIVAEKRHGDKKQSEVESNLFLCQKCKGKFKSSLELHTHMFVNHTDAFKCYMCKLGFNTPAAQKVHIARCHKRQGSANKETPDKRKMDSNSDTTKKVLTDTQRPEKFFNPTKKSTHEQKQEASPGESSLKSNAVLESTVESVETNNKDKQHVKKTVNAHGHVEGKVESEKIKKTGKQQVGKPATRTVQYEKTNTSEKQQSEKDVKSNVIDNGKTIKTNKTEKQPLEKEAKSNESAIDELGAETTNTAQKEPFKSKQISCPKCKDMFKSSEGLHKHMFKEHLAVFKCHQCEIGFATPAEYSDHVAENHDKKGSVMKLTHDKKKLDTGSDSTSDKKKSGTGPDSAKKTTPDNPKLKAHLAMFKCYKCTREFSSPLEYSDHLVEHHDRNDSPKKPTPNKKKTDRVSDSTKKVTPDKEKLDSSCESRKKETPDNERSDSNSDSTKKVSSDGKKSDADSSSTKAATRDDKMTELNSDSTKAATPDEKKSDTHSNSTKKITPDKKKSVTDSNATKKITLDIKETDTGSDSTEKVHPDGADLTKMIAPDNKSDLSSDSTKKVTPDKKKSESNTDSTKATSDKKKSDSSSDSVKKITPDKKKSDLNSDSTKAVTPDEKKSDSSSNSTEKVTPGGSDLTKKITPDKKRSDSSSELAKKVTPDKKVSDAGSNSTKAVTPEEKKSDADSNSAKKVTPDKKKSDSRSNLTKKVVHGRKTQEASDSTEKSKTAPKEKEIGELDDSDEELSKTKERANNRTFCRVCKTQFLSRANLAQHLWKKHGKRIYLKDKEQEASSDDLTQNSKSNAKDNDTERLHKSAEDRLKSDERFDYHTFCRVCKTEFRSRHELAQHLWKKHGKRIYLKDNEQEASSEDLTENSKSPTKDREIERLDKFAEDRSGSEERFDYHTFCLVCKTEFRSRHELAQHVWRKHGKRISLADRQNARKNPGHPSYDKSLTCRLCYLRLKNKDDLFKHLERKHDFIPKSGRR